MIARELFKAGSARLVLAVMLPRSRALHAPRHGDDDGRPRRGHAVPGGRRRCAGVVDPPRRRSRRCPWSSRSRAASIESLKHALGLGEIRVIPTGGDPFESEREQWDDGNNLCRLEPGVVVAYERNVDTNTRLRKEGIEVITISGLRARARPRRLALHDLPARTRRRLLGGPHVQPAQPQLPQGDRLHDRGASASCSPVGGAQDREVRRHRGAAAEGQGDRADLREDLDAHALGVRGGGLRPGRPRDVPGPFGLADGPQGVDRRHRARARPHVRRASSTAAPPTARSRSSPRTRACPSTTA